MRRLELSVGVVSWNAGGDAQERGKHCAANKGYPAFLLVGKLLSPASSPLARATYSLFEELGQLLVLVHSQSRVRAPRRLSGSETAHRLSAANTDAIAAEHLRCTAHLCRRISFKQRQEKWSDLRYRFAREVTSEPRVLGRVAWL
jgi:hypothetical protein